MTDTGDKKYNIREAINRIFRSVIGSVAPNDAPDSLSGIVYSVDEAISKLAELFENKLAGQTGQLPDGWNIPSSATFNNITSDGDITASGTVSGNLLQGDTAKFGDVNAGDYAEFESDGTLILNGGATVWEDLRFPALALRAPASGAAAEPDLVQFRDDDDGSTGVFSFAFDPDTEEEMYFAVQMPHSWAGTPIEPHVHWSVMTNCTGTVGWAMEYTWAEITGTFGFTTFTYNTSITPNEDNLIAYRHYLSDFPAITGTFGSGTLSSMMVGRIFRDATESLTSDSCPEDAVLLELDFHFEIDRLGSNDEYVR